MSGHTKSATAWVVALTGIGSLMASLDTMVVSTALSTIRMHLGASVAQLEWTVNAYNLSFAVLLITGAALGDRFGRRNLFAAGLALFAAASAACALAPSVGWLIAARAVQGGGSALLMPLGLALLSSAFPAEKRGAALGIYSAITGLSVASGPLVGGAVVQGLAWQWIFWINVPIALVAVPLVLTKMKESYGPDSALDLRGLALITGGALAIVWGWCVGTRSAGAVLKWSLRSCSGCGILECGAGRAMWLPYVEVDCVDEATDRARKLGAGVLLAPREGPAGWRSVIATPEGGEIALWQQKGWRL